MNNNSVINNNNYGRLQGLILLFKIPAGTRKNFFEVRGQLGHAPSEQFASSALGFEEYVFRTDMNTPEN
jgi:hypothetical protein